MRERSRTYLCKPKFREFLDTDLISSHFRPVKIVNIIFQQSHKIRVNICFLLNRCKVDESLNFINLFFREMTALSSNLAIEVLGSRKNHDHEVASVARRRVRKELSYRDKSLASHTFRFRSARCRPRLPVPQRDDSSHLLAGLAERRRVKGRKAPSVGFRVR